MEIDDTAAEVVRRIFAEYVAGNGDRAIAGMLNTEGAPCPSARRRDQNRHRLADGWQGSTVRAILDNPRYTGYAVFGRWVRRETLLDPDDVAAGYVTRFRRAAPERIVRSRTPAHPAIVSVELFTRAQLLRRTKSAGGLATARKAERGPSPTRRPYLLRGMVHCGACGRRMQGEDAIVTAINGWIGQLFDPPQREHTVAALLGAQPAAQAIGTDDAKARRADADQRLRRFNAAIAAGVDPEALVEAINQAQAERRAAQAEIDSAPVPAVLTAADVNSMIDSLSGVGPLSTKAVRPRWSVCTGLSTSKFATYRVSGPRTSRPGPVWIVRVSEGDLHVSHNGAPGQSSCLIWLPGERRSDVIDPPSGVPDGA